MKRVTINIIKGLIELGMEKLFSIINIRKTKKMKTITINNVRGLIELDTQKLYSEYFSKGDTIGDKVYAKKEEHDIEGFEYSIYFYYKHDKRLDLYLECELKESFVRELI